jgi:hypothetical protein
LHIVLGRAKFDINAFLIVLQWSQKPHAGIVVPDSWRADGTRQPIHEATARPLATTTAAPASSRAGGQAFVADIARRLAP